MKAVLVTTEEQLKLAKAIRTEVFVKEQGVEPSLEYDEFDTLSNENCFHLIFLVENEAAGNGRLRLLSNESAKLQRICVLAQYRGLKIGQKIVQALEQIAISKGIKQLELGSQIHAQLFYEKLGYNVCSAVYQEAGIDHVKMMKTLI